MQEARDPVAAPQAVRPGIFGLPGDWLGARGRPCRTDSKPRRAQRDYRLMNEFTAADVLVFGHDRLLRQSLERVYSSQVQISAHR